MSNRRTAADIRGEADSIVAILKRRGATRAEELSEELDVPTRSLEKPLKLLRREKEVTTSGDKRWTYYSIPVKRSRK